MAAVQKVILSIVVLCCFLQCGLSQETDSDSSVAEGRTFGHHFLKRLSFAVIPAAFVVGVVTTLLAALTVVSMKGLGVGVILLILALGQMLARSLPFHSAAAHALSAPVPFVHGPPPSPVWIEKGWR